MLEAVGDYVVGAVYEYACPLTYYKDVINDTESGEKKMIKGLRGMFKEGHRTFRINKVHEGKSTALRNYVFTPLDQANTGLTYN